MEAFCFFLFIARIKINIYKSIGFDKKCTYGEEKNQREKEFEISSGWDLVNYNSL